jgi:hypothetical protein
VVFEAAQHVLAPQFQLANLCFQADQRVGDRLRGVVLLTPADAKPDRGEPGSQG